MNAKQSLRLAAKKIEDLEYFNARCVADIKAYNQIIDSLIDGGTLCDWCHDREECEKERTGIGCDEWMLAMDLKGVEKYEDRKNCNIGVVASLVRATADDSVSEDGGSDGMGVVSAGIIGEYKIQGIRPE